MRFALGPIRENPEFHPPDGGWQKLREPGPFVMQLFAIPVALAAAAVIVALVILLAPGDLDLDSFFDVELAVIWLIVLGTIPVHELLHMLAHPQQGRSPYTIMGFWPSRLLFYAHFDNELSRNRFLIILMVPFLVLSVAPVIACAALRAYWPWVGLLAVYNAFVGGGDLFGVLLVLLQVPADATVRNKGYYTWWRK